MRFKKALFWDLVATFLTAGEKSFEARLIALGGKRQQRLDLRHRNSLRRLCMAWHGEQRAEQDRGERVATQGDGQDGSDEGHGPK